MAASRSCSPAGRSAPRTTRWPAATCRSWTAPRSWPGRPGWTRSPTSSPIDRGRTPGQPLHVPGAARDRRRTCGRRWPTRRSTARSWSRARTRSRRPLLLGPRPRRPEAGRRDRRDAGIGRGRLRRTGQPARRGPGGRSGVDARRRRRGLPGRHDRAGGRRDQDAHLGARHVRQPERRLARARRRVGASGWSGGAPAGAT